MKTFLLTSLLPLIVGPITALVMQSLKRVSAQVDELPPTAKRLAVLTIASVLTVVSHATGVPLDCDPAALVNCLPALNEDAIKAVVGAAVAFGLHALKKAKDQRA